MNLNVKIGDNLENNENLLTRIVNKFKVKRVSDSNSNSNKAINNSNKELEIAVTNKKLYLIIEKEKPGLAKYLATNEIKANIITTEHTDVLRKILISGNKAVRVALLDQGLGRFKGTEEKNSLLASLSSILSAGAKLSVVSNDIGLINSIKGIVSKSHSNNVHYSSYKGIVSLIDILQSNVDEVYMGNPNEDTNSYDQYRNQVLEDLNHIGINISKLKLAEDSQYTTDYSNCDTPHCNEYLKNIVYSGKINIEEYNDCKVLPKFDSGVRKLI